MEGLTLSNVLCWAPSRLWLNGWWCVTRGEGKADCWSRLCIACSQQATKRQMINFWLSSLCLECVKENCFCSNMCLYAYFSIIIFKKNNSISLRPPTLVGNTATARLLLLKFLRNLEKSQFIVVGGLTRIWRNIYPRLLAVGGMVAARRRSVGGSIGLLQDIVKLSSRFGFCS